MFLRDTYLQGCVSFVPFVILRLSYAMVEPGELGIFPDTKQQIVQSAMFAK